MTVLHEHLSTVTRTRQPDIADRSSGRAERTRRLLPIAAVLGLALGMGLGLILAERSGMSSLRWDHWARAGGSVPAVELAPFSFSVTADMRSFSGPGTFDSPKAFRGAVEAIADLGQGTGGPSAFMISPGDFDPAPGVLWTITRTLGVAHPWYPVVGNHDMPGGGREPSIGANLRWLLDYDYGVVSPGPTGCPTTTYSLDYGDAHFVMLNQYCDAGGPNETDGDVTDHLYDWLAEDLARTDKRFTFVVGHEPAFPLPDADTGRIRHRGDSLDAYPAHRDRFWRLLRERNVTAYLCGHTHNYSAARIDGVWQVDVGHARGIGDTGAPSTFVMIHVEEEAVWYATYRANALGLDYQRRDVGYLVPRTIRLPLIIRTRPL